MSINQNFVKWIMFYALLIWFPSYIFLILAGLINPVAYILIIAAPSIISGSIEAYTLILPNILFWSFLLYFISKKLAHILFRLGKVKCNLLLGVFLIFLASMGFAPIYDDDPSGKLSVYSLYAKSIKHIRAELR